MVNGAGPTRVSLETSLNDDEPTIDELGRFFEEL